MATPPATEPVVFWFVQRPRPSIDLSPSRFRQADRCVVKTFPRLTGHLADDTDDADAPVQSKPSASFPWIDPLPGLPSRMAFYRRLGRTLRSAAHAGQEVALFIVDVDDFSIMNDAYGSACGDAILSVVVHRLSAGQAPAHGLARVDADSFAFVVSGPNVAAGAQLTAHRIRRGFRTPIVIGGLNEPAAAGLG